MDLAELYKNQGSILILVIAKSGRGKTTAMRTLPPDQTYLINVIGKALPFLGGAANYRTDSNMMIGADAGAIQARMREVSGKPQFNYLVLDDMQYVMATEFMQKIAIKGYDKFSQMANNIWSIMLLGSRLRAGLKVFMLTHEDDSTGERKMKTLGKLLDEKLTPEGLATIVLYADVIGDKDQRKYVFQTQSDGVTNAKSPLGMFPLFIPNDLKLVADRVDEYYSGVELSKSALTLTA